LYSKTPTLKAKFEAMEKERALQNDNGTETQHQGQVELADIDLSPDKV
jgi:hypothetical protein